MPNWTSSSGSALSRWSRSRKLTSHDYTAAVCEAMTAYGPA
jgi:hypothetical protein